MHRVPKCFMDVAKLLLLNQRTCLKFDNFLSEPIPLLNRTTQGDPSSMTYYGFYYYTPLMEMATSDDELLPGFVNDFMVLAVGDSLGKCHTKLKDTMEHPNGGFAWSLMHNSIFDLSKTVLMNFPGSYRDPILGPLSLNRHNSDGSITTSQTHPVALYKYLGVLFNPQLRWTLHQEKTLTMATFWTSQIGRLTKALSGVSTSSTKQLYNTVAKVLLWGRSMVYKYL